MSKKTFVTNITPLPPSVSRATAIAALHDHSAMIKLNPLVIRHNPTLPPPHASEDEFNECRWYEITDTIAYLPGGMAKGEITYKGGFYDQPYGLQTHVFAPAGVDIRAKWSVRGNMPGEPREAPELGVDAPKDGLYLREDVELKCNMFLKGFVKKNLKKSHVKLVEDLMVRVHGEEEALLRRRTQSGDYLPNSAEQRPIELDAGAQGGQVQRLQTNGPRAEDYVRSPATAGPWEGESVPWPRPSPPVAGGNALERNPFSSPQQRQQSRQETDPVQSSIQKLPHPRNQRPKDYIAYGPQARIPKGGQHSPWRPQSSAQDAAEHAELPAGTGANAHEIGGDEVEYWRLAAEGPGAGGKES